MLFDSRFYNILECCVFFTDEMLVLMNNLTSVQDFWWLGLIDLVSLVMSGMSLVLMFFTSFVVSRMSLVLMSFTSFTVVCISLVVLDFMHFITKPSQCIMEGLDDGKIFFCMFRRLQIFFDVTEFLQ